MGEVVAVLSVFAGLLLVGSAALCWLAWRTLRRRNEVTAGHPTRPPLRWLVWPTGCARLHRRLRASVVVLRAAVPARRVRRRRSRRRDDASVLETLAAEIEAHAVVLDGELLLVARARGASGTVGRQQAGAPRRRAGAECVAHRRRGAAGAAGTGASRSTPDSAGSARTSMPATPPGRSCRGSSGSRAERYRVSPWQEVGDGCFRRRYQRFDLNIGVVRGSDALLVLDTRADLRQADELLRELTFFGQPVRWVVNSHWHFDHVFGNQRFVEAAHGEGQPGAVEVAGDVELWGHRDLPETLLADETELRSVLRSFYGDEAGDEYDRVVLTPPDHLVAERVTLDLGDRAVELVDLGRGHTGNDIVVVIPAAGWCSRATCWRSPHRPPSASTASRSSGRSRPVQWRPKEGPSTCPATATSWDLPAVTGQVHDLAAVANLIRELFEAGVPAADALREAGDRWPYPADSLVEAVSRGYTTLAG